jgi:replicative DNA helicase
MKHILTEQNKLGLVIIDYLQLIKSINRNAQNRVQELSNITRSLKILAREFNIPIIALSQLSRNVENRIDQKPILSDLRESGSIDQDSDLILLLGNGKKSFSSIPNTDSLIELIVAKQRNGPTGTIFLSFNKSQTKFVELDSLLNMDN